MRSRILADLYRLHFKNERRERLFLASLGFLLTFGIVRGITLAIRAGVGPFHNVTDGGTHIHHLVWGILLLLAVGFCWLAELGTGAKASSLLASRLVSLLYGVGAALTLDEFALWLHLQEGVYWTRRDLISIDAVVLFGAALLIGIFGGGFLKALGVEMWGVRKRRKNGANRHVET